MQRTITAIALLLIGIVAAHPHDTQAQSPQLSAHPEAEPRVAVEKRDLPQQARRASEQSYVNALKRYRDIQARYEQDRREFVEARERLHACETNCGDLERDVTNHAQAYLNTTVERMIAKLQQIKPQLAGSGSLNATQAAQATAAVEDIITQLESMQTIIATTEDKNDLQDLAKRIRAMWGRAERTVDAYTSLEAGRKIGLIINQAAVLRTRLECAVTQLNQTGTVADEIQTDLVAFDNALSRAESNFDRAMHVWDGNVSIREMQRRVKDGHAALKEAHQLSREILHSIRDAGGNLAGCVDETPRRDDAISVAGVNVTVGPASTTIAYDNRSVTIPTTDENRIIQYVTAVTNTAADHVRSIITDENVTDQRGNDRANKPPTAGGNARGR